MINSPTKNHENHEAKIRIFSDNDFSDFWRELLFERAMEYNWEWITELDLFNICHLNKKEAKELIKRKIGVNVDSKEGLEKINILIKEALHFYNTYLFKNTPQEIQKIHFTKWDDVIDFLNNASKKHSYRQIYCTILKLSVVVNDIMENPSLQNLDKKWKELIKSTIVGDMQIIDRHFPNESPQADGYYVKALHNWTAKAIPFTVRFRWKSKESSVAKSVIDPKQNELTIGRDAIWIEFILDKKEDIIFMLEYIFIKIYNKNIEEFRQKYLYDKWDITEILRKHSKDLDEDFKNLLKDELDTKVKALTWKWEKYKDIKFIGQINLPESKEENSIKIPYGVEVRCILENNKNNSWMSDHRIREGLKRLFAISRLQWYVTEVYIKRVIEKIKEKYPRLPHSPDNMYTYYINQLFEIQTKDSRKTKIYTTPCRWNWLSWTDIYPKEILRAKDANGSVILKK